jgi:hypothetical protein
MAVPPLAFHSKTLDPLVTHRDRLSPPVGDLVFLLHVPDDLPVGPEVSIDPVEGPDPALPGAPGLALIVASLMPARPA